MCFNFYLPNSWNLNINQGLWMNIAKDQLFCLLGPNGAGKTTTINCLTGINPVTGGDGKKPALFYCFCFVEASVLSISPY